jgi:hypothetical protein
MKNDWIVADLFKFSLFLSIDETIQTHISCGIAVNRVESFGHGAIRSFV